MQIIKKQNFPVLTCSKKKKYDIKIMSFVTNTGYGHRANPLPYPVFYERKNKVPLDNKKNLIKDVNKRFCGNIVIER